MLKDVTLSLFILLLQLNTSKIGRNYAGSISCHWLVSGSCYNQIVQILNSCGLDGLLTMYFCRRHGCIVYIICFACISELDLGLGSLALLIRSKDKADNLNTIG